MTILGENFDYLFKMVVIGGIHNFNCRFSSGKNQPAFTLRKE